MGERSTIVSFLIEEGWGNDGRQGRRGRETRNRGSAQVGEWVVRERVGTATQFVGDERARAPIRGGGGIEEKEATATERRVDGREEAPPLGHVSGARERRDNDEEEGTSSEVGQREPIQSTRDTPCLWERARTGFFLQKR